jgi:hypothetical protein
MPKGMWIKKSDGTDVFDSRKKTSKDYLRDIYSVSLAVGADHTEPIAHGLGAVPSFKVYCLQTDGYWRPSTTLAQVQIKDEGDVVYEVKADSTYLYLYSLNLGSVTRTAKFKYFLFKNQIR